MFEDGLPMGGPLFSLMANKVPGTAPNAQHVLDYILCAWSGSFAELRQFLVFLKSFHSQISFTLEEGIFSINTSQLISRSLRLFLSFLLTHPSLRSDLYPSSFPSTSIPRSSLFPTFSIFRYTGILTNGGSFHPYVYKLAGVMALIHRLSSIPLSPADLSRELSTIRYSAALSSLDIDVTEVVNKKLTQCLRAVFLPPPLTSTGRPMWIRLPFIGPASYPLVHYFKKYILSSIHC